MIEIRRFDMKEGKAEILYNKGCELANNKKYIEAIPFFEQASELGNEYSNAWLASIYIQGHGVEINYDKGIPYLEKSVKAGHPYSINLLGTMYYYGNGLKQDYEQAFTSFCIAAEKGEPYALLNLAECYELGKGTKIDIDEALNCYFELIDEKYEEDIKNKAFAELEKYPDNAKAQYYLSKQYDGLTISGSEPNPKKAAEFILKAAELGDTEAQYEIGKFYESGFGIEKDIGKAKKWLEKAAEKGHSTAIYTLKYMSDSDFFRRDKNKNSSKK